MKTCKKCGEIKALFEFANNASIKCGKTGKCKKCISEYARDHRNTPASKAREKLREQSPERKAQQKAYFESDISKEKQRAWKKSESGRASVKAHAQSDLGKATAKKGRARYDARHPSRQGAHNEVNKAIQYRGMPRAATLDCEASSAECDGRLEYHHDSYRREDWLSVRVLCKRHHEAWHKVNSPIEPDSIVAET